MRTLFIQAIAAQEALNLLWWVFIFIILYNIGHLGISAIFYFCNRMEARRMSRENLRQLRP